MPTIHITRHDFLSSQSVTLFQDYCSTLLVFSAMSFKKDKNKNGSKIKTVQQIKSRISEKEESKTLARIQVTAMFLKDKICGEIFYPELYGNVMLVPIRMRTNIVAGNQQKHLSLSCYKRVLYLSRNSKTLK